jgi:hypothetical protein
VRRVRSVDVTELATWGAIGRRLRLNISYRWRAVRIRARRWWRQARRRGRASDLDRARPSGLPIRCANPYGTSIAIDDLARAYQRSSAAIYRSQLANGQLANVAFNDAADAVHSGLTAGLLGAVVADGNSLTWTPVEQAIGDGGDRDRVAASAYHQRHGCWPRQPYLPALPGAPADFDTGIPGCVIDRRSGLATAYDAGTRRWVGEHADLLNDVDDLASLRYRDPRNISLEGSLKPRRQ